MFQGKVILLVDDEADLREILRNELIYEGATVVEAANGKEALQKLEGQKFDAVLSDIRMPGGDGATLASQIRDLHPYEPVVILITGFADLHSEEAFAMGADGYVVKPFRLDELKQTVKRLLNPPEKRWTEISHQNCQRFVISETLADALKTKTLLVGRGGFFLKADPDHIRNGELVEVEFKEMEPIQAQVRWVRSDADQNKPQGLGLEFMQIPTSTYEALCLHCPQWRSEKSFIPNT